LGRILGGSWVRAKSRLKNGVGRLHASLPEHPSEGGKSPDGPRAGGRTEQSCSVSDDSHVFGARSLGTATFIVRDPLAFAQIFEADSLEIRHMEEQIAALARLDESESLIRQLLDFSLRHESTTLQLRIFAATVTDG